MSELPSRGLTFPSLMTERGLPCRLEDTFSSIMSERGNPADLHLSDSLVRNVRNRREYRHLLVRKDGKENRIMVNNGENSGVS